MTPETLALLPAPLARFVARLRHGLTHTRITTEHVAGRDIIVLPGVFNPALFFSSAVLAEVVGAHIEPGQTMLELGTGTGVVAITASLRGARVTAVDIDPEAARCARINALAQRCETLEILEGDLFGPVVGRLFARVVFNPPYFRGAPGLGRPRAFFAGDVAERFADGLAAHLEPGGEAWIILSDRGDEASFLGALGTRAFAIDAWQRRRVAGEWLTVYRATSS